MNGLERHKDSFKGIAHFNYILPEKQHEINFENMKWETWLKDGNNLSSETIEILGQMIVNQWIKYNLPTVIISESSKQSNQLLEAFSQTEKKSSIDGSTIYDD